MDVGRNSCVWLLLIDLGLGRVIFEVIKSDLSHT